MAIKHDEMCLLEETVKRDAAQLSHFSNCINEDYLRLRGKKIIQSIYWNYCKHHCVLL